MKARIFVSLVLFILGLICVRADNDSIVMEKLRQIPPATAIIDIDEDKLTPMLVLTARGALINHSKTPVPCDQVLRALANLPKKIWLYCRVILYFPSPPGISLPGDRPLPADVKKVEADLKAAGIQLHCGTSN